MKGSRLKNDEDKFAYGAYEEFYADARTKKVLEDVDLLAKRMKIEYAVIGGLAAYIHRKNPPEDYPDIDVLILDSASDAIRFIKTLTKKPKYHVKFVDIEEGDDHVPAMVFAAILYDRDIQVDIFTSSDAEVSNTVRKHGVELEMIEPLIVEKLIRGTEADIRIVIDLLAHADYNRKLLSQIGREFQATGMLEQAAYWARRWAAGRLDKRGLDNVVKRLSK